MPLAVRFALSLLLFSAASSARAAVPAPEWLRANAETVHADDPALARGDVRVRWRDWSSAAFADAQRLNRPILLFITANWVHRGRVMDRTTFTDVEIATRINEEFIPIRLDRDARPDLDLRLQLLLQALYNSRGWPLTVFLTPEGRAFYGGTYFPVDDDPAQQRQGMRAAIQDVLTRFRGSRTKLTEQATAFEEDLKRSMAAQSTRGELPARILDKVVLDLHSRLDPLAGGFNGARELPQFPAPRALELCLAHYARTGNRRSRQAVETTLDAMLSGGIYDLLEGGFHRHSADRWWRLPRFEKLLILNAEMLPVLLHAWQATGTVRYKRALDQTLDFWLAQQDPRRHVFPGSIAADVGDHDDGDYFLWTLRDIESVFDDPTDRRIAALRFGIEESGEMLSTAPDRNVLWEALSLADVAARTGLTEAQITSRLATITARLLEVRRRRPAPTVDRTVHVDANAMMAAAFIECGRSLGRLELIRSGLATIAYLEQNGASHHALLTDKPAASLELAQDRAALAWALSVAGEGLGMTESWNTSRAIALGLHASHWDAASGGYSDRAKAPLSDPSGILDWPVKTFQDTHEPSPNGIMAMLWMRMGEKEKARATVEAAGTALEKLGAFGASMTGAADAVESGLTEIHVIGPPDSPHAVALFVSAQGLYAPWKTIRWHTSMEAAGIAGLTAQGPMAVVLRGGKIDTARDPAALEALLAPPTPK